jgi:predicted esterase
MAGAAIVAVLMLIAPKRLIKLFISSPFLIEARSKKKTPFFQRACTFYKC